jgi:hypothetical protein
MVGSSQTDLPSVTDPRTWESTHCILSPIRPHGLDEADNDLLSSYCERGNHYISRIGFDNFPGSGEECIRDLICLAEEVRQERDEAVKAAEPLPEHEAKIAALERMVGRQALEIELLKGALKRAGLRAPTLDVAEEARNGKT